jgi:hypothetical protein
MSNIKKHTDVVASMEEFTTNYNNGAYTAPWIVYVGNNADGYSVIYSNDENKSHASATPDIIDSLAQRLTKLENEKVFCYEEEYDILVANKQGWVTNLDGTRSEVVFDANKLYCIYEEEGPAVNPDEPSPEEPTPEEPTEPETPVDPNPEEPSEPNEPNPEEPNPEEPNPDEPSEPDIPVEPETPEEPDNGEEEPGNDEETPNDDLIGDTEQVN